MISSSEPPLVGSKIMTGFNAWASNDAFVFFLLYKTVFNRTSMPSESLSGVSKKRKAPPVRVVGMGMQNQFINKNNKFP
jgi:hypothetical protein